MVSIPISQTLLRHMYIDLTHYSVLGNPLTGHGRLFANIADA